MADKIKYELEFLLKTSSKALDNMLFTPAGLSEWFADDVNLKDDILTFEWEGSEEEARILSRKINEKIKWQWIEDEDDGIDSFCELRYQVDPMTKAVILNITDFAEESDMEESKRLWEQQIGELKRVLGA
ncbi:MAG: START-like domain-containing protein [Crocinitomicaceae bacterium]